MLVLTAEEDLQIRRTFLCRVRLVLRVKCRLDRSFWLADVGDEVNSLMRESKVV